MKGKIPQQLVSMMEQYKNKIFKYLEEFAKGDEPMANALKKKNKNMDDCLSYIAGECLKQKDACPEDAVVYQLARHYYLEDIKQEDIDYFDWDRVDNSMNRNSKATVKEVIKEVTKPLDQKEKEAIEKAAIESYKAEQKRIAEEKKVAKEKAANEKKAQKESLGFVGNLFDMEG